MVRAWGSSLLVRRGLTVTPLSESFGPSKLVDKHLSSLKTLRKLKKPRGKKIILPCEGKEVSLILNPDFERADEHPALLLRQTNES